MVYCFILFLLESLSKPRRNGNEDVTKQKV